MKWNCGHEFANQSLQTVAFVANMENLDCFFFFFFSALTTLDKAVVSACECS